MRRNHDRLARFFYRLKDDDFVSEFCVANWGDPYQRVESLAPDGTPQDWDRREEGDLLVFRPPDGYSGDQGLMWVYDGRLQGQIPMPRKELERRALNMRLSVNFG